MTLQDSFFKAIKERNVASVKDLLTQDKTLRHAREQGISVLSMSAYYGARDILEFLIEQDAKLDLFEAATVGDLESVQRIVEENPTVVESFSQDGWTALHLASFFNHPAIVELLVSRKAPINVYSKNAQRNLPIHAAAASKNINIVMHLLENGSEVNVQQVGGYTPLHEAVISENQDLVQLLLAYGAYPGIENDKGETAVTLAKAKGYDDLADQLNSKL